jgi:hypothetical protein
VSDGGRLNERELSRLGSARKMLASEFLLLNDQKLISDSSPVSNEHSVRRLNDC